MRTAALMALLMCLRPAAAPAQAKNEGQLTPSVRLYVPKNISEQRARQIAEFVNSVMARPAMVHWDDVPHALVIRSTDPAELDAAEALLKRFDVPGQTPSFSVQMAKRDEPGPSLDCTVYLIRASKAAATGGRPEVPVPPELQSAIDEMKKSFAYNHYSLWDTQVIHGGAGSGDFQGILPEVTPGTGTVQMYTLSYKGYHTVYSRPGSMVFDDFMFSIKSNALPDGFDSHIKTSALIGDGQKLVLGKIRLLPGENTDLFLVLATKAR